MSLGRFRLALASVVLVFCLALGGIAIKDLATSHRSSTPRPILTEADRIPPATSGVLAFNLSPRLSRSKSAQQTLRIPAWAQLVRLELELEDATHGTCEGVLFTAEDQEILRTSVSVTPGELRGRAELPASVLRTDDYILEVRQAATLVASYSFRVLRNTKK